MLYQGEIGDGDQLEKLLKKDQEVCSRTEAVGMN